MFAIPDPAITISCLHYEWDSPSHAFERAGDELGLDGIEFSWPHPALCRDDLALIRQLSEQSGLEISVHVWDNLAGLGVSAGVERMLENLRVCTEARFGSLVVHGGSHDDRQEGVRITAQVLRQVAPAFEDAGVVICLENHYAYEYHGSHELFSTPEEFMQVFDQVPSPCVGFLLDYGHSQMTGNTGELLRALASRLVYTHLADNMGGDDDHLAFGRGVVPWREVLELTRSVGYRGPFTIEFPVRDGTYDAFHGCVAMLRELFGPGA